MLRAVNTELYVDLEREYGFEREGFIVRKVMSVVARLEVVSHDLIVLLSSYQLILISILDRYSNYYYLN